MKTIDSDRLTEIADELEEIVRDMRSDPGDRGKQRHWRRRLETLAARMHNLMKYGSAPPGDPD